MTRIAICGLGNIGQVHLRNLRSIRGCQIVGLYDKDTEKLESLSVAAGARAYGDEGELFRDSSTDAVVIATPTDSHRDLALRALAAGKHVFIADSDIQQVESWLEQQGFSVDGVARSKNRITFSGTVGQAEAAFGTEIHYYGAASGGKTNYAPSADLTIPAALSSVVQTVGNVSSFRPKSHARLRPAQLSAKPNFTSSQSGDHYLTPGMSPPSMTSRRPIARVIRAPASPSLSSDNRPSRCRTSRTSRTPPA